MKRPRILTDALFGQLMGGVWLLFLVFIGFELAQRPVPIMVPGFALMAVFVAAYLRMLTCFAPSVPPERQREQVLYWLIQLVCVLLSIPVLGWLTLAYSPYLVAGSVTGMRMPYNFIVGTATTIISIVVPVAMHGPLDDAAMVFYNPLLLVVCSLSVLMVDRGMRAETERRHSVVIAERNRIASDVHDLLGHSLTVVNLKVQLVERLVDRDPERAKSELAEIRSIVSEALAGVRETVSLERSKSLPDEVSQAVTALRSGGVEVEVDGDPGDVDGPIAFVLAWIVRESTTNVLRHAHAARTRIAVAQDRLTVEDDGDGLSVAAEGNGIRGMKERVAAAGGALTLGRSQWGGTKVEVTW